MRCDNCMALGCSGYEYPEEFCKVGGDEECGCDWDDGSCGCTLHPQTVRKRLREYEEGYANQYLDYVEWIAEQEFKEKTGIDVSDPNGRYVSEAKHCIGLDHNKPYKRHGKLWFKPYRNYFNTTDDDEIWKTLTKIGHAKEYAWNFFCLTDEGRRWLGRILGITIKEERD